MKVLAILQNAWFHDPDRVRAIMRATEERHGTQAARELKRKFCARALFAGCRTGQVLRMTLGDEWCRKIEWENASPELGAFSASRFPADHEHIRQALKDANPDVVLAYGKIASDALIPIMEMTGLRRRALITGPHPTARQTDTWARLREMRERLDQLQEVSVHA